MDGAQVRIWPDNVMDCLAAMEIELQAAGFPPMSPWWWDTLRSFYASGKRQLVARVGRRGGKSSTVSRVAVAEVLTRRHRVQPGDTGVVAVVSVDRREAADRVATMHAILRALNIAHKPKADGIELPDRPYAIAIRTGSISGVSGFTCICALGDEVSKWKDTDTGVNPAEQVLSSWRPTMATMPGAKMFLLSSPMGSDDAHARAFDAGNNAMQMVAYAPTWVAHPALTQGMLEAMESNRRIFRREYEAVPSPEVEGSLLTSQELERATEPHAMRLPEGKHDYIAALDTATRSQVWSLAIVTSRWDSGRERVTVVLSRSWCGTHDERPDPSSVLREVSAICAAYGIHGVRVDKGTCPEAHQRTAMEAGIALVFENLSRLQWLRGYDYLAALCAEDRLGIPDVEELRSDLLTVKKKVTATGADIELAKGADQMHAYHSLPLVLATYRGVASPDPEERERTPGELLQDEERRHWKPVLEKLAEYRDDWYDV
jgi:hypothetical protein